VNGGQKVPRRLIIASGNATELLQFGKEVLDQMTCLIDMPVEAPPRAAMAPRRDHRGLAGSRQTREDALVRVERRVGDQHLGLHVRRKVVGTDQIVRLAARQDEGHRIAERIDESMDFDAPPAA